MFFSCFFGRRESEDKVEGRLYRENRTPRTEIGRPPSLGHAVTTIVDVVFESAASPTVLYQLSLTGNMSSPYLRGEGRRGKEKTEEHLQRVADRLEVKKKQAVKTLSLNDGAQTGKRRKMFIKS